MPLQNPALAARPGNPQAGIGDKIRGAMAVGKTRWGMLALVTKNTKLINTVTAITVLLHG